MKINFYLVFFFLFLFSTNINSQEMEAQFKLIEEKRQMCLDIGFKLESEKMADSILQLMLNEKNEVVVTTNNNSSLSEQNRIMEEQTRIMERQLRQQRLENLRESQKTFQKMIDGTCSFC